MSYSPNILLVGTGAVGSYFGARLMQGGARVSVMCRSDYDIVKNSGIRIKSSGGDYQFIPIEVVRSINDYSANPDYIIAATKVLPEIQLPELIGKKVLPGTSIVLLQNGIEIEEPVAKAFPDNELISAIAYISVSRPEYGVIDHQEYGKITLGRYPAGTSEAVEKLAGIFQHAGVPCAVDGNIIAARWKKLVWNAAFNPISVLAGGATTREIVESPPLLHLAREVMREIIQLAGAAGTRIPLSHAESIISDTLSTKPLRTSMLQDHEHKRPLEVEAILGNPLRIARRHGITLPHCESLYGLLKMIDEKNRR